MKKIMMIGNSHIDPVWLWRDSEGMQEVRSTFSSALDRMEEFDEFCFSASSAQFYEWIKDNSPDLFEKIKEKVKEGRWFIVGGFWVEPDCNIPSGESFVRQALYAQHFFLDNFGTVAKVGFNVDSFGHSLTLPQILSKSQITGYVFMRPHKAKLELPSELIKWTSPDKSYVSAFRIQGEYCSWTKTALNVNLNETFETMQKERLDLLPCFYGVGNHGGGPTIENIKSIREVAVEKKGKIQIEHNSLDEFFKSIKLTSLKEYKGDLHTINPGCYSSDTILKKHNHKCETNLFIAESLSILAFLNGYEYPIAEITKAWKKTLFNQFHDTLAGTSRHEAHEDAIRDFNAVLSTSTSIIDSATQFLAQRIDTRGDGYPLIIFNPNSFEISGVFEKDLYWRTKKPMRLRDSQGFEIPYQFTNRGLISADSRKRIIFETKVPPLGFAVMRMIEEQPQIKFENEFSEKLVNKNISQDGKENNSLVLGNNHIKAAINLDTGNIESLLDSTGKIKYIQKPIRLELIQDKRDAWGAEGELGDEITGWKYCGYEIEEDGPIRQCVRLDWVLNETKVITRVILGKSDKFLTLNFDIRQFQGQSMLSLNIPIKENKNIACHRPYGFTQLSENSVAKSREQVTQRWMDFEFNKKEHLLVVNDGSYSTIIEKDAAKVVFTRSVPFSQSVGEEITKERFDHQLDFGEINQTVLLMPYKGEQDINQAFRTAEMLSKTPIILADNNHKGEFTLRNQSFISLECDNAIISTCKLAEKSKDIIIRIHETSGKKGQGILKILDKEFTIEITEHSIDTYKYNMKEKNLIKTDLLEFEVRQKDG